MLTTIATLNLIITVQSLFLTFHFILKKKGNHFLNKVVALLSTCFSVIVFNTYYSLTYSISPEILQDIANNSMWFLGPSVYVYVRHKHLQNKQSVKLHFLPYLIPFIYDLFFTSDIYNRYIPIAAAVQIISYFTLTLKYIAKNYNTNKTFFQWILPTIAVLILIILLNIILRILSETGMYETSAIFRQSFTTLMMFPIFFLSYKEMNSDKSFGLQEEKYKTTKISDDKTEHYLKQIKICLETEKQFLDSTLTLTSLSKKLSIPSKYISQIVNQELKISFSDYLLNLRVDEAKKLLIDPEKIHLSIAGIAEESGFSSISRFNHHFKARTGQTPSEYRNTILKS